MNFYSYFPQLLSNLSEIRRKRSVQISFEHLGFAKIGSGMALLLLSE